MTPSDDGTRPCTGCGYDVRGLPADGVCPECAAPVARALQGNRLRYADPAWLARVRRGLSLAERTTTLLRVVLIGAIGLLLVIGIVLMGGVAPWLKPVFGVVVAVIGLGSLVLVLAIALAMWWVSTPDPGQPERTAEVMVLRAASMAVLPVFGFWRQSRTMGFDQTSPWILPLIATVCALGIWALKVLVNRQAEAIELRCPDRKRMRPRRWWLPGLYLALYWAGPFRLMTGGTWTLPDADTNFLLLMGVGLSWFASIHTLARTRAVVKAELTPEPPPPDAPPDASPDASATV